MAGRVGSGLQEITDNPQYDAEPVISRDGEKIVFGWQRENDIDIYIMSQDGSNVQRFTDTIGYDGGLWISPDGRQIVWRAWHPETAAEKVQWLERITSNKVFDSFPMFSIDGRKLVFGSNRDPDKPRATDIYIAD